MTSAQIEDARESGAPLVIDERTLVRLRVQALIAIAGTLLAAGAWGYRIDSRLASLESSASRAADQERRLTQAEYALAGVADLRAEVRELAASQRIEHDLLVRLDERLGALMARLGERSSTGDGK